MGLILAPLILMWLAAFVFSVRLGFAFADRTAFFPETLIACGLAFVSATLYAGLILSRRKHQESVGAFQYVFDFTLQPLALMLFTVLSGFYFFSDASLAPGTLGGIFIALLTLSLGTLMGVFGAESYMERNGTKRIY